MNSEIIRTFITLSEEKSYVKAAYSLFVTQPTVTKRIKELESEMGKTLFNKNGNSISLTKEGVIFLDYALKYEELEKKVHSDFHATNIYTDTVNIGSTKCIYESHLRKPTLQLMNDKEKSLSVNVRLDHSKLLYSGLNNNITDSNLNHTGIYLYSKGKIMIHLTFDYKTDEKCTTPGQYLKYHRTFQGFTTRELAEKVGIVPATLVLYENDRHPIKHSTAVALANALGIDRNRLLDKYTAFVDYPYSSLLKKVRQELSLTQMQMAEVIGIGQTSYSGWEREIRVPRRKEYEKILAALKKLKVNVDIYLCHPAST